MLVYKLDHTWKMSTKDDQISCRGNMGWEGIKANFGGGLGLIKGTEPISIFHLGEDKNIFPDMDKIT